MRRQLVLLLAFLTLVASLAITQDLRKNLEAAIKDGQFENQFVPIDTNQLVDYMDTQGEIEIENEPLEDTGRSLDKLNLTATIIRAPTDRPALTLVPALSIVLALLGLN